MFTNQKSNKGGLLKMTIQEIEERKTELKEKIAEVKTSEEPTVTEDELESIIENIEFIYNSQVDEILGKFEVDGVRIKNTQNDGSISIYFTSFIDFILSTLSDKSL